MSAWAITANPVYGRAEDQVPIAVFSTRERAIDYIDKSRVSGERPLEGGYWRSFVAESLLYDFNGGSVGDYHEPELSFGGWCINPCIWDIQLHELEAVPTASGFPIDPRPPLDTTVTKGT